MPLTNAEIRSWQRLDAESLARHANNRKIWRNLRDAFPHPYSLDDAHAFLKLAMARNPESWFAIAVNDQAVGGIGITLHNDVERVSAEIGYWLGEAFWGRGIMTEAVKAITEFAIDSYQLTRVYALPFEWNEASVRVLEKAGYLREARLRRCAIKDGQIVDQFMYAYVPATLR
jgi:RimJ/RimL family protein N-acetyltransferase